MSRVTLGKLLGSRIKGLVGRLGKAGWEVRETEEYYIILLHPKTAPFQPYVSYKVHLI